MMTHGLTASRYRFSLILKTCFPLVSAAEFVTGNRVLPTLTSRTDSDAQRRRHNRCFTSLDGLGTPVLTSLAGGERLG